MNAKTFLATPGRGIARAERDAHGWSVEFLLQDQRVTCFAADPHKPGVVYAGTQRSGVLRSGDGGKTWKQSGMEGQVVKALAASPAQPGLIYAGTKPAFMFVSRDGGKSWLEMDSFRKIPGRRFWFSPAEAPFTAYVQAIAPSPVDPGVVLAGIEFGAVVRSEDGGQTWSGHRRGALRDCHGMTFHAASGDWVYESGGTGGGVSFSRDAGKTWRKAREGLDRNYGWACAADPGKPEVWYASLSPGPNKAHIDGQAEAYIYRAVGGARWEKLGGGLPQPLDHMPYALLTDPAAPGHLYAGLSSGDVWHTGDYGDNWTKLDLNLRGIHRAMVMLAG
jgi:photosystem II stability/assembly factor-like uncharacterized protein